MWHADGSADVLPFFNALQVFVGTIWTGCLISGNAIWINIPASLRALVKQSQIGVAEQVEPL
jgi:hypothetical protein